MTSVHEPILHRHMSTGRALTLIVGTPPKGTPSAHVTKPRGVARAGDFGKQQGVRRNRYNVDARKSENPQTTVHLPLGHHFDHKPRRSINVDHCGSTDRISLQIFSCGPYEYDYQIAADSILPDTRLLIEKFKWTELRDR